MGHVQLRASVEASRRCGANRVLFGSCQGCDIDLAAEGIPSAAEDIHRPRSSSSSDQGPAFPIGAADEAIGSGKIGGLQLFRVPFEFLAGAEGDRAEQVVLTSAPE